jgi:hypothetical protein
VPSADGKGWHFTPNERSRPLAEQDKEGHKVQLAFYKDKDKAEDPDVAVAKADPEFVAAAKSLGLSPEDPVRLTKLFR